MIHNVSHQSTIVMASVVCCFSIRLTQPKGALWGNTKLSKHKSPKKHHAKTCTGSAWVCARKRFWSKTPAFPNTPLHHFHSGITGQLSDSADGGRHKVLWQLCVCVTGLDIWGFEVVEALPLCALPGKEWAHSEHWRHQSLSSIPASPNLLRNHPENQNKALMFEKLGRRSDVNLAAHYLFNLHPFPDSK